MKTVPAPLENKIALITGGSRGIGAALVRKFAQHGCSHIAITYHNNADLARQVLASAQEIAPRITTCAFAADLSDPEFGPKVIKEALMALGVTRLDIVIANAAPNAHDKLVPVEEMGKKNWDYHITGGAWSALSLAKAAIGHMPPRDNGVGGGGRIVFVSAVASKIAFGDPTIAYSAAKAAMDSVSKNLANVWGTRYGVTVNTISVGGTMTDGLREGIRERGPELKEMVKGLSFLKKIAEPEEVAEIVAFVASPAAGWIIGNQIPANGGGLYLAQS